MEGQSRYFFTNSDKVSTTKKTGKRKRGKHTKPTLEERLIHLERLYNKIVPNCFSNKITEALVTVLELRSELYRLQPSKTDFDFYKTKKEVICHLLYEIRETKRNDRIFTPARDLLLNEEIQIPLSSDNNKNCNDDLYSVVDQEYCREVVGENSGKVGTIVI